VCLDVLEGLEDFLVVVVAGAKVSIAQVNELDHLLPPLWIDGSRFASAAVVFWIHPP
jgi:hypothetical protein